MGRSGSGKSSLLRVIAGLWSAGSGRVTRQADSEVLFIPQNPYMPIGNLRRHSLDLYITATTGPNPNSNPDPDWRQLLFPNMDKESGVSDDSLFDALEKVRLGAVAKRVGGLDANLQWEKVLSTGEQQRVAFARVFLSNPRMLFLDEATSALDAANEKHLYESVNEMGCSFVSVGHRPSLIDYHDQILLFTAPGVSELLSREEYLETHGTVSSRQNPSSRPRGSSEAFAAANEAATQLEAQFAKLHSDRTSPTEERVRRRSHGSESDAERPSTWSTYTDE